MKIAIVTKDNKVLLSKGDDEDVITHDDIEIVEYEKDSIILRLVNDYDTNSEITVTNL